MSQFRPLAAAILAIALSCAAYATPAKAGGRGGGGFGAGGGSYSGGGTRAGGGPDFDAGAPHFGGGTRADEGPRFDADTDGGGTQPGGRQSAGDGGRYSSGRSAAPSFNGADRNANPRSAAVSDWLNAHAMVHGRDALRDRDVAAATARDDRNEHGWWWRHRHHRFGWLGSLFWPFAYDDAYDNAASGYGDDRALWDYDYKDIYGRIFPHYDRDDLADDLPRDGATAPERQASREPGDPEQSPAAADPVVPQTTARPATPPATARQTTTPRAIARPATPPATSRPMAAQATAQPTTPHATAQPLRPQAAAAQPPTAPTPRATAQATAPQATAPPAMAQAAAQPTTAQAMAQALAPPTTAQSAALPTPSQATAPPTTPQATIHPSPNHLAQLCGDDSRDIAGFPIDQIQRAIAPNGAQVAALDELGNASIKAAQDIRAACPRQVSAAAPAWLAMMQQRIEGMIAAVLTVRPALDKFYGLLDDGQKARLNAIGPNQRKLAAQQGGGSLLQSCGSAQAGVIDWPIAEMEAKLQLTATQRSSLTALVDASAKASDMFKEACQPDLMLTPPARLAAIGNRLDVMLLAIKTVRTPLDDFYNQLSADQKARFDAIGSGHTAASAGQAEAAEQTAAPARRHPGRPHASIGGGAT